MSAVSSQCFKVLARFTFDMHPSESAWALGFIRSQLDEKILRCSEGLGGVMLCYANERLLSQQAFVHDYFPLLRVHAEADCIVLRPEPGTKMVGHVTAIGQDYLGLLVLGAFNAVIPIDNIPSKIRPNPSKAGQWVHKRHSDYCIEQGTHIVFQVDQCKEHFGFFSITGSLKASGTGPFHKVMKKSRKKAKKRKHMAEKTNGELAKRTKKNEKKEAAATAVSPLTKSPVNSMAMQLVKPQALQGSTCPSTLKKGPGQHKDAQVKAEDAAVDQAARMNARNMGSALMSGTRHCRPAAASDEKPAKGAATRGEKSANSKEREVPSGARSSQMANLAGIGLSVGDMLAHGKSPSDCCQSRAALDGGTERRLLTLDGLPGNPVMESQEPCAVSVDGGSKKKKNKKKKRRKKERREVGEGDR